MEALHAAPFHNSRSSGPGDGMEKSFEEIHRLLARLPSIDMPRDAFVMRGSTKWMTDSETPVESDATADLIERALASPLDDPLYVVAIGAITNVASALLLEPAIRQHIVLLWLGGHARHWPDTREFNLRQDPVSSSIVLDCGVPLVRFPCMGVVSHLHTTLPEMTAHVMGKGAIGDYLYQIYCDYHADQFAYSKQIWDLAPLAWLVNPNLGANGNGQFTAPDRCDYLGLRREPPDYFLCPLCRPRWNLPRSVYKAGAGCFLVVNYQSAKHFR